MRLRLLCWVGAMQVPQAVTTTICTFTEEFQLFLRIYSTIQKLFLTRVHDCFLPYHSCSLFTPLHNISAFHTASQTKKTISTLDKK
jgi:hypothetical protein